MTHVIDPTVVVVTIPEIEYKLFNDTCKELHVRQGESYLGKCSPFEHPIFRYYHLLDLRRHARKCTTTDEGSMDAFTHVQNVLRKTLMHLDTDIGEYLTSPAIWDRLTSESPTHYRDPQVRTPADNSGWGPPGPVGA